jgi:hypothetical protein
MTDLEKMVKDYYLNHQEPKCGGCELCKNAERVVAYAGRWDASRPRF